MASEVTKRMVMEYVAEQLRGFWQLPGSEQSRVLDAAATTLALHRCTAETQTQKGGQE